MKQPGGTDLSRQAWCLQPALRLATSNEPLKHVYMIVHGAARLSGCLVNSWKYSFCHWLLPIRQFRSNTFVDASCIIQSALHSFFLFVEFRQLHHHSVTWSIFRIQKLGSGFGQVSSHTLHLQKQPHNLVFGTLRKTACILNILRVLAIPMDIAKNTELRKFPKEANLHAVPVSPKAHFGGLLVQLLCQGAVTSRAQRTKLCPETNLQGPFQEISFSAALTESPEQTTSYPLQNRSTQQAVRTFTGISTQTLISCPF